MIIPIKQILLEGIILEITALKARQMSLKAGIIPDHNTNWKGALKKVRGARGELTSGKELNDIKQKIGFPENNVLQKLKSTERKSPTSSEVGYSQKTKNVIGGRNNRIDISVPDFEAVNKNNVGFIHTHPDFGKYNRKLYNIKNLDRPSGLNITNYNNRFSLGSFDKGMHDIKTYSDYPKTKFPIYAPSGDTVSVSRIFLKKPNPVYAASDTKAEQKYKDDVKQIDRKMDIYRKLMDKTDIFDNKYDIYRDKWGKLYDSRPPRPKLHKEEGYYKMNHSRYIEGKENYNKFNLNGERIK